MNNQQLAVRENTNLAPSEAEFGVMKEQSLMLLKSGFLPPSIKTPEQAIAIILTGRELGIGTMQALNNITVIQGKPTVSPQLMLALIQRSGQLENIVIQNKFAPDGTINHVACTMKRKGMHEHTEIFGAAEANKMGLLGKDNYKKQAGTMFKWRAVAACARVTFPDVILGFYTPDEMGAEDAEVSDDLPAMPQEETAKPTVVKMPQSNLSQSEYRDMIEAEVENHKPGSLTWGEPKPDYTDEWNAKLAAPTVKKEVAPVSPQTKAKLLVERGCVEQTNAGFEVKDEDDAEYYTVTKPGGVIKCTCAEYTEKRQADDRFRCAHIEAVKLYLLNKPQRQAA